MTARILLAALLCLFATPCLAYEKGYYAISDEDLRCSHLLETIRQATFRIDYSNVCAENITLRSEQKPGESVRGINLSKAEAHSFLQKQDKKDLLVIWFDKVIWRIGNNEETLKQEYRNFVADLGFKRVLMLGGSAFGTQVLEDTDEIASHDPEHSQLSAVLNSADATIHCEGLDRLYKEFEVFKTRKEQGSTGRSFQQTHHGLR